MIADESKIVPGVEPELWQEYMRSVKQQPELRCGCIYCDGGPCAFTQWKENRLQPARQTDKRK